MTGDRGCVGRRPTQGSGKVRSPHGSTVGPRGWFGFTSSWRGFDLRGSRVSLVLSVDGGERKRGRVSSFHLFV